jgi:colicin import membrane protein
MSNTNKRRVRRAQRTRRAQGSRRAQGTRRAQGKRRAYSYIYKMNLKPTGSGGMRPIIMKGYSEMIKEHKKDKMSKKKAEAEAAAKAAEKAAAEKAAAEKAAAEKAAAEKAAAAAEAEAEYKRVGFVSNALYAPTELFVSNPQYTKK